MLSLLAMMLLPVRTSIYHFSRSDQFGDGATVTGGFIVRATKPVENDDKVHMMSGRLMFPLSGLRCIGSHYLCIYGML